MFERLVAELGGKPATVKVQPLFREPVRTRGISTAAVRVIAKAHGDAFAGLSAKCLWESGGIEKGTLAVLRCARPKVEADIPLYWSWRRRYVKSWAHCDAVGMELLGPALERVPRLGAEFVSWKEAPEWWVRRQR